MVKKKKGSEKPKKDDEKSGLIIWAGVCLGLGVGFLVNNPPAGLFIGLGAGLLGAVFLKIYYKK